MCHEDAFDGQHTRPKARMNHLHEVGVSMQGISRGDARAPRLARQDRFGDGDLVGFLRNAHLEQRFLTGMGTEGQQMRRLVREGTESGPGIDADLVFARLRAKYAGATEK